MNLTFKFKSRLTFLVTIVWYLVQGSGSRTCGGIKKEVQISWGSCRPCWSSCPPSPPPRRPRWPPRRWRSPSGGRGCSATSRGLPPRPRPRLRTNSVRTVELDWPVVTNGGELTNSTKRRNIEKRKTHRKKNAMQVQTNTKDTFSFQKSTFLSCDMWNSKW